LGREIALHLARQGYAIGLHYYTSSIEAQKTAEEIRSNGKGCLLLRADLRDIDQVDSMFTEINQSDYELKLLVNSAAIMPKSNLLTIDSVNWDEIMNTNLRSVWLCSQRAAQSMRNGGIIINITDSGASKNWIGYGAYVISKAGVEVLTRVLARELAPMIRVCAIAPGLLIRNEQTTDLEWNRLMENVPMNQAGNIASITSTLDLLLKNEYITGEIIHLDGGSHLG
jgi:NAD(P)-dependent dehydrogenase (short-subunit alcohol dehydrogenase family)